MNVWKVQRRVYYTRSLQATNRHGNMESACTRVETTWSARLPSGKILTGFDRRRDAVEATKRK